MLTKKQKSYRYGLDSEDQVIRFLESSGYTIINHRYLTPLGEIDIIAAKDKFLVCIEVKARKTLAEEYLSRAQCKRYLAAAEVFLAKNPQYENYDIRFDLIIVINGKIEEHFENAWSGFDF